MPLKFNPFTETLVSPPIQGDGYVSGDIVYSADATRDFSEWEVLGVRYGKSNLPVTPDKVALPFGYRPICQYGIRNGIFWFFGGYSSNGFINEIFTYNPETKEFTRNIGTTPTSVIGGAVIYDPENDIFYYGFGSTSTGVSPVSGFYKYDPGSNSWTTLASNTTVVSDKVINYTFIWGGDGYIYLFARWSYASGSGVPYNKIFRYDIANDFWELYTTLTTTISYLNPRKLSDGRIVAPIATTSALDGAYVGIANSLSPEDLSSPVSIIEASDVGKRLRNPCPYEEGQFIIFGAAKNLDNSQTQDTYVYDMVGKSVYYLLQKDYIALGCAQGIVSGKHHIVGGGGSQWDNNIYVFDINLLTRKLIKR